MIKKDTGKKIDSRKVQGKKIPYYDLLPRASSELSEPERLRSLFGRLRFRSLDLDLEESEEESDSELEVELDESLSELEESDSESESDVD